MVHSVDVCVGIVLHLLTGFRLEEGGGHCDLDGHVATLAVREVRVDAFDASLVHVGADESAVEAEDATVVGNLVVAETRTRLPFFADVVVDDSLDRLEVDVGYLAYAVDFGLVAAYRRVDLELFRHLFDGGDELVVKLFVLNHGIPFLVCDSNHYELILGKRNFNVKCSSYPRN